MARWLPRSVRARVTAVAVAVVALTLVAVGLLILAGVRDALVRTVEATADAQARGVATLAEAGRLPPLLEVDSVEHTLLQVVDAAGAVRAASPQLAGLSPLAGPAPASGDPAPRTVDVVLPGAEPTPYRLVGLAAVGPDGPVTVYAGSSLADAERAVGVLAWLLLVGGAAALAVVGAVTWLVVGRALRPVESLRAEVDAITSEDADRRVEVPGSGDEVARLAETMNGMLSRLEAALVQQRRLVADVSHEIRNPVSSLRTQLEVALAHPELAAWEELARDLLADTERLADLAGDLLLLARLDAGEAAVTGAAGVDLGRLVRDVVDRRPPARVPVRVDPGGGVVVRARPAHLVRILDNLIDNAERHAATEIRVGVGTRAPGGAGGSSVGEAVVEVRNDGDPLAPGDAERIFERFVRLDDARARDTGGTGLGLPIARQLARAHGGDLRALETAFGASFVLSLPLAPVDPGPPPVQGSASTSSATSSVARNSAAGTSGLKPSRTTTSPSDGTT